MNECPSAATLARLGLDPMQGETLSTIEGHIAACPDCQAALNRMVQNDASPMPPTLPGRDDRPRIPGFVIDRELGRGSMSVVYLARQPSLGRMVALKVVRSGPAAGSHEYARWLREGRAFSMLRHENVVRLHDVGEAGGWLYLVLEYVPGGTLHDRLEVPYTAADAARLLSAIAEAVEAIHRAGLLHLDLKPSNILMDAAPGTPRERAIPRVGDFGLASPWDDPDATATAIQPIGPVGTPRYMAPEQIGTVRDQLTPAADVYGLGALLYHAITGRPPFVAPSVAETLDQVRGQDPVPPRRLNPAIPRDLETICLKCLRKEPDQRYASAQAVADDLRRFLDGVAIAARPASLAEKTWRWCRRRPTVAALAAALAMALCGGFLGMFLLWRQAESQRTRAESAQARTEAEVRRATALLGELIELNAGGIDSIPRVIGPDRKIALLQLARRNLVELADRLPDREAMYSQLMAVDQRLGDLLRQEQRYPEARSLYEASLLEAEEAVRRFPLAPSPRLWRHNLLHRLGELAESEHRPGDLEALLARDVELSEDEHRDASSAASLNGLVRRRYRLARALAAQGRRDEARALLLASHRALEDWPADRHDVGLLAARVLDPILFRHLGSVPPPPGPADDPRLAAAARLAGPEADRLPAEAWARSFAAALGFDDPEQPATFRESQAAHWFAYWLQAIASDDRNRGDLPGAVRTADRFLAFARLCVRRNPSDATAHLVLADAHEQVGKNAWRTHDRPTIEASLRRSIAATQRALELSPTDEIASHNLDRRQRKLDDLLHPKP